MLTRDKNYTKTALFHIAIKQMRCAFPVMCRLTKRALHINWYEYIKGIFAVPSAKVTLTIQTCLAILSARRSFFCPICRVTFYGERLETGLFACRLWSSLKTDPARPGHGKIALVITAGDFDQFSLYSTGTSLFSNDHIWHSACSHFTACIKGPNTGSF